MYKVMYIIRNPGVDGEAETHVPIPNTVVKGFSGDGTVYLTAGE